MNTFPLKRIPFFLLNRSFSPALLKKSLKFSYPKLPINLVGMAYSSVDKFMLNSIRGVTDVGYYDFGGKFANFINMAMESIANAWGPFFLEQAHQNTEASRMVIVMRFYEVAFGFMLFSLGVVYFSEEGIRILATPEFYPSMYVVPVYTYFYLTGILAYLGANQIMHGERMMVFLIPTLVSMVFNILLNLLLIPSFGAVGAAIATALAAFAANVVMLYVGLRAYPLPLNIRRLVMLFSLHIVFILAAYPLLLISWPVVGKLALKLLLLVAFFGIGVRYRWISIAKIRAIFFAKWSAVTRSAER